MIILGQNCRRKRHPHVSCDVWRFCGPHAAGRLSREFTMCRLTKTCAILILAVLIFSMQAAESRAISSTKITEVKISEDLRRVIVKANGLLNPVQSGRLESPSRLAIQVPDASLGDVDHTISNPDNGALLVRVSSSGSGVRLVLDFGKAAVPEYRMRLMDDCLIVFLGSPGTHPADTEQPSFSSAAGAAGSQPPTQRNPPGIRFSPRQTTALI